MSFGMFGAIFLLAQFLQTVQHDSPLGAGIRTLPWTGMPILIAPLAGLLVDKIGGKTIVTLGLAFQAAGLGWFAIVLSGHSSYAISVPAFVLCGIGMSLFFVPVASLVLGAVPKSAEGIASGTNNAIRELGGVLGVAVLGAIFASSGGYRSNAAFVAGLIPAVTVGAIIVGAGALLMVLVPRRIRPVASVEAARESMPALGLSRV
jgi:MFS family permease